MSSAGAPTHDMIVTREFDAPVEGVWRAWSEADQVMRWWGPTGFTSPLCNMDFRVGGRTLVCMRAPKEFGGQDMYNTWTYQKIEPLRRIALVLRFSDKDGNPIDPAALGIPPGVPATVAHVITFTPLAGGRTALTIVESGYATHEAAEISKAGMNECLEKMAASVATP